ncbi:MAG TPA: phosphate ABC transporter permease PstA [Natrialbaceae archaeon]|nr:phosphate ABC transporter permease PstA [Natrialbaceae archaeon]
MSGVTESEIYRGQTTAIEAVPAVVVGVAAVLFALALAALLELVTLTDRVAGASMIVVLGSLLVLIGIADVAFGVGSRLDMVETKPEPNAGLVASVAFGGIWFVVGGLIGSQTLGAGLVGWLAVAILFGFAAFGTAAFTREDLGSTLPAGAFAILAGIVFVTGAIGPAWTWEPNGLRVTFFPKSVVPLVVLFAVLVAGWAAAKAYGGFGARGRHVGAHLLIYLNAGAIIAVLIGLVAFVTVKGFPAAVEGIEIGLGVGPKTTIALFGFSYTIVWPIDWPFLMNGAALLTEIDGVLPAIVGTVWLVVGAVLFAVPLGVGAAVFLSEYAEQGRFTQVVEIATNGLWSTPSIVFGLFGYAFLIPRFGGNKSLISGMLTLGFMLLPLVVITSREAMLSVPDEYRDASAALGVSKWQTIRSVVLPAALPGVVTGVILGVGRIAGETAPILLTMAGGTFLPGNQTVDVIGGFEFVASPPFVKNDALLQATSALPYQVYALIKALGGNQNLIADPEAFGWGLVLVLLGVVLSFYAIGIVTRYYFRKRLHG